MSLEKLQQIENSDFTKFKHEDDILIRELFAIGKRDCERFVAICNYYLEHDYDRFQIYFKPVIEEMIKNYRV